LQLSAVHGLLSSQLSGVPATHPVVGLHVSMPLQALPSLQLIAGPLQTPPVQMSPVPPGPVPVHMLLSLHGVLFATGVFEHRLFAQLSVVHGLLSLQGSGFTTSQRPSFGLQARVPLAQMLVLVQPVAVGVGVPVQVPLVQTGFCRHRSVSVQVFALFAVWTHPFVGSHVSSVHGLLSLQSTGVGVPQAPVV
jgi:hypothetical protein